MNDGVPCMWMRGGTSKGGYFIRSDLPEDDDARAAFLLAVMGSPDMRQIDGMGGADPLTSKVAVVTKSSRDGVDVDYLFLQVAVGRALVSDAQNCGNLLAGVGPFAIERGLVAARNGQTPVTIYMENTGQTAIAQVDTPDGHVTYGGDAHIDGVPGVAAPVPLTFQDTAGSSCGALLPTGHVLDTLDGIDVTCIDNGMPCVLLRAADLSISGTMKRDDLDSNSDLKSRLETIRLKAGRMMNLGDVIDKTVPKMTLVLPPAQGGVIATRTFIPHRCHASIGVLGAVSVATACLLNGSVTQGLAVIPAGNPKSLAIEHLSGQTTVIADMDDDGAVRSAAILRTARKLMDGRVFGR